MQTLYHGLQGTILAPAYLSGDCFHTVQGVFYGFALHLARDWWLGSCVTGHYSEGTTLGIHTFFQTTSNEYDFIL